MSELHLKKKSLFFMTYMSQCQILKISQKRHFPVFLGKNPFFSIFWNWHWHDIDDRKCHNLIFLIFLENITLSKLVKKTMMILRYFLTSNSQCQFWQKWGNRTFFLDKIGIEVEISENIESMTKNFFLKKVLCLNFISKKKSIFFMTYTSQYDFLNISEKRHFLVFWGKNPFLSIFRNWHWYDIDHRKFQNLNFFIFVEIFTPNKLVNKMFTILREF